MILTEKEIMLVMAGYMSGYESGHDDTADGSYTDSEQSAIDWVEEAVCDGGLNDLMNKIDIKQKEEKGKATTKLNCMNECYHCKHRQNIVGESHIRCLKPDPKMRGGLYGFNKGWFIYPACFDPVWKLKMCENFENRED